jgi:hypothetical protein
MGNLSGVAASDQQAEQFQAQLAQLTMQFQETMAAEQAQQEAAREIHNQ